MPAPQNLFKLAEPNKPARYFFFVNNIQHEVTDPQSVESVFNPAEIRPLQQSPGYGVSQTSGANQPLLKSWQMQPEVIHGGLPATPALYAQGAQSATPLKQSELGYNPNEFQGQTSANNVPANIPSGILLRDNDTKKIYFIDNGKKRLITSPAVLTPGSGFVDVDPSLLSGLVEGAAISQRPSFNFKSAAQAEAELKKANIDPLRLIPPIAQPGEQIQTATGVSIPAEVANSDAYQSLPEDVRGVLDAYIAATTAQDEQTRARAQEALKQAQEIVDPYSKILLKFALDAIPDNFRVEKQSLEDKITSYNATLQEIGAQMNELPLAQQQELQAIQRSYEGNIKTLQDNLAGAGLAYSSTRADLERQLALETQDIQRSTSRGYETRLRQLQTQREENERTKKLVQAAGEAQLKALARGAEEQVGTSEYNKLVNEGKLAGAPAAIGATEGTGEFGGTLESERQAQILQLGQTIQNYQNPEILKNLYAGI